MRMQDTVNLTPSQDVLLIQSFPGLPHYHLLVERPAILYEILIADTGY